MIYLDNGATTYPKPPNVISAVNTAFYKYGANPGRGGHEMSLKASGEVFKCRENIQKLFNVKELENIIFTLNCTQSLNIVIKGILKPGDHAVVSCLEHNSVMRPLEKLKKIGVTYSVAKVYPEDDEKTINSFREALNDKTRLVICTHASNVFGIRLPIERICALCHQHGILFCADCAQSAGVLPIDVDFNGYDFICCAGHKGLYGPMGTGVLVVNTDALPDTLIEGGTGSGSMHFEQPAVLPDKYESGTPNVVGICGLGRGVEFVLSKTPEKIHRHEMKLIKQLYRGLSKNKKVILYTSEPSKEFFAPVLSFSIEGLNSEEAAKLLNDDYSIAVRAGLHCSPLAHEFMGTTKEGTVRVCPSVFSTEAHIKFFIKAVNEITRKLNL